MHLGEVLGGRAVPPTPRLKRPRLVLCGMNGRVGLGWEKSWDESMDLLDPRRFGEMENRLLYPYPIAAQRVAERGGGPLGGIPQHRPKEIAHQQMRLRDTPT